MRFDIVTLFPELFDAFFRVGVCGRAAAADKLRARFWHPRDYAPPPHRVTDERPYGGGGGGMVLSPAPVLAACRAARAANPRAAGVYLTPRGAPFSDSMARCLAKRTDFIFLCGRYGGIDERAVSLFGDMFGAGDYMEISAGDYVLSGGEPAALCVMDALLRHVPGVLGNPQSAAADAFAGGMLAPPCYTRPPVFENLSVPEVLLSGDHAAVAAWRRREAEALTKEKRPDLLAGENKQARAK